MSRKFEYATHLQRYLSPSRRKENSTLPRFPSRRPLYHYYYYNIMMMIYAYTYLFPAFQTLRAKVHDGNATGKRYFHWVFGTGMHNIIILTIHHTRCRYSVYVDVSAGATRSYYVYIIRIVYTTVVRHGIPVYTEPTYRLNRHFLRKSK